MQTPSFAVLIALKEGGGVGHAGTSVGKLMRGEHNNDARSGEAKKGQLSEAEAESQPSARTAVVGLTYATPPCRVGKRPCKQGPQ